MRSEIQLHVQKFITEDEKEINVTISMGIAEFNRVETGEALFERADKALYNSKTNGRNQVQVAE